MKKSELRKIVKEVLTEGLKKYRPIVKAPKELGADDKKVEYILSLIANLEREAWRNGAREGFQH